MPDKLHPPVCCDRPAVWGGTWSEGYGGRPETWRRADHWRYNECRRAWTTDAGAIEEAAS